MKNYQSARTGCRFVSSFFIHTSSFVLGHPPRPTATRFPPWPAWAKIPCNVGSGKPIVATVPPRCAERLAAIGNGENFPTAFNKARSFAASALTDFLLYLGRRGKVAGVGVGRGIFLKIVSIVISAIRACTSVCLLYTSPS